MTGEPVRFGVLNAPPLDVYGTNLSTDSILPARGIELPINAEAAGGTRVLTQSPSVEAIPTPSAFEGGLVALAVVIARHVLGRRRRLG